MFKSLFTPSHHARALPARRFGPALFLLLIAVLGAPTVNAAVPLLTDDARRAHLNYYAPVIMKGANESDKKLWGADWITNFDFDRDGDFSNNRAHWKELIGSYVSNSTGRDVADWRIRPTLYTALLEFRNSDTSPASKSIVMLYHVYHAMEEDSIHDWERIEIRVDNVGTKPGGAEKLRYVVVTNHTRHMARKLSSTQLNFMTISGGKHPIIYQAEWTNKSSDDLPRKNELRFVSSTWAEIDRALKKCPTAQCPAQLKVIDGEGKTSVQPVHYVFVPETDLLAKSYWKSVALSAGNASSNAAKTNKRFSSWNVAPAINYELQDLADILATHGDAASCGANATEHQWGKYPVHWVSKGEDAEIANVWMQAAIWTESRATVLVPTSTMCRNKALKFYRVSKDGSKADSAQGYPHKHWFWGAYVTGVEGGGQTDEIFDGDGFYTPGSGSEKIRRCAAGIKDKYWCQHDYYLHTGNFTSDFSASKRIDDGKWLPEEWYRPVNGGFDGRWVQLFPDRYE